MFIRTFSGLATLVGAVWLLQGIGLLEGSFMTGSRLWAGMGAVLLVAGVAMMAIKRRADRSKEEPKSPVSPQ